MVKVDISISESDASLSNRANHALGVIKQALLDSGYVTVSSDNDPAAGSGVNRIIDFVFLGSDRKVRMEASWAGTYWQVSAGHRNVANTGYVPSASGTIIYTNTASAKVYLLYDSRVIALCGYSLATPFVVLKTKGTKHVHFIQTSYMYISGVDTRYTHQGTNVQPALAADGVTSLFVAYWNLCSTGGLNLYTLGDDYRFDNNLWAGEDKFNCTDKQMLEISTGNYLVYCNPFYVGYMA